MFTDPYRVLAVVLCTLVAGIAGILVVWHPMETSIASFALPSRMGSIQTWAGVAVIEFVAMGLAGLLSYVAARNHAVIVNWTALAGGLIMVTLAASEPNCNPAGSITSGLMIAALFAGAGWVDVWLTSNPRRPRANSENILVIPFVRGSSTAYMAIVVVFAITATVHRDINVDLLGAILIFCGIGVTASATLSAKWNSQNIIALLGFTISIVGAGVEMDRAFHKHAAPFQTWHVLLVAALMWMALTFPFALQIASSAIRNVVLVLVAFFVGAFTFLMAVGILMIIIGICGVVLSQVPWSSVSMVLVVGGLIGLGAAVCTYFVVRRMLGH